MCGSGADFGTIGNIAALTEYSTVMVKLARGDTTFPFPRNKMDISFYWRCNIMQEITFYCKRCKKSTGITYRITGNDTAPVLANIDIKCFHCKRVMYLKKYTEKMLVENSVGGRFYI